MIPLIDTFFLILAFFISSVLSMEVVRGLPVDLPEAAGAAPLEREGRILVTLSEEGGVQLEGEPLTLEQLKRNLAGRGNPGTLRVGVRADGRVPYRSLVELLDAVRGAGVARVALLASPQEKGIRR